MNSRSPNISGASGGAFVPDGLGECREALERLRGMDVDVREFDEIFRLIGKLDALLLEAAGAGATQGQAGSEAADWDARKTDANEFDQLDFDQGESEWPAVLERMSRVTTDLSPDFVPNFSPDLSLAAEEDFVPELNPELEREEDFDQNLEQNLKQGVSTVGERRIVMVPLAAIDANYLVRDRDVVDMEAFEELKHSIAKRGMRVPIELVAPGFENGQECYGLLTGFRRITGVRALMQERSVGDWDFVPAIVRRARGPREEYIAMVEENEIRQNLCHYERGRIAVVAAERGVFEDLNRAVNQLFSQGSKAKRSKIRSFALIYQQLDDVLCFPHALTERKGLVLANALKRGKLRKLRRLLDGAAPKDAKEEWALIERAVVDPAAAPKRRVVKLGDDLEVVCQGRLGKFRMEFSGFAANLELRDAVLGFVGDFVQSRAMV